MDELKEHIRRNEDLLNTEKIGRHVWLEVSKQLPKARSPQVYLPTLQRFINWLGPFRANYIKWAVVFLLPLLLILSFAAKVSRVETIGNVISFNVRSNNTRSIGKILRLEQSLGLRLRSLQNIQPGLISFVTFIQSKDSTRSNQMMTNLRSVPDVFEISSFPVNVRKKESLFSRAFYKMFDAHIDLRKPNTSEITKNISVHLQQSGINNIMVEFPDGVSTVKIIPVTEILHTTDFTTNDQPVESTSATTSSFDGEDSSTGKNSEGLKKPGIVHSELVGFDWLLHAWRTIDSSQSSYHRWLKVSDSVYRSFVINLAPQVTIIPAFYLYSNKNDVFLAKDENRWVLQQKDANLFLFQRESQEFPHTIQWDRTEKFWWFRRIRGSLKDEISLYIDDSKNRQLDRALAGYKKQHPALFR